MASEKSFIHDLVGESEALKSTIRLLEVLARTELNVLVQGENGTGKELAVQAIHRNSDRWGHPFVIVNCATGSRELLESEWFGHEKGSFTGASEQKLGKFELADGGTLFLDEIGETAPELQAKLLRAIEYGTFQRLGGVKEIHVDVRVIAATNKNLSEAIRRGAFREDLYHRLSITSFAMPPLRERREDIPILARHFISTDPGNTKRTLAGRPMVRGISPEAISALSNYEWPGNVRQLRNVIRSGIAFTPGEMIQFDDLHIDGWDSPAPVTVLPAGLWPADKTLDEELLRTKREFVLAAHKHVNGDPAKLAKMIPIHKAGLPRYLDSIGLSHLKQYSRGAGPTPPD